MLFEKLGTRTEVPKNAKAAVVLRLNVVKDDSGSYVSVANDDGECSARDFRPARMLGTSKRRSVSLFTSHIGARTENIKTSGFGMSHIVDSYASDPLAETVGQNVEISWCRLERHTKIAETSCSGETNTISGSSRPGMHSRM